MTPRKRGSAQALPLFPWVVLKDMDPARLPHALNGVVNGEAALPRALVARVVDEFRARGKRRSLSLSGRRGAALTSREWEVLELMREKLTTREIAGRLDVADVTVRRHVGAILRKLRVQSRKEALELVEEAASAAGASSASGSPGA